VPAVNNPRSQSGYAALYDAFAGVALGPALETGAHRASIRAVAAGRADVAAIDAVAWRLAELFEPAALRVQVLGLTRPTPGLPMITALGRDPHRFGGIIARAIECLAPPVRSALGLAGFVRLAPQDYLRIG